MQYAVALSEHPDPGVAIGEVVGQVLDRVGPGPDLAVLFMTGHHVDSTRQSGQVILSTPVSYTHLTLPTILLV